MRSGMVTVHGTNKSGRGRQRRQAARSRGTLEQNLERGASLQPLERTLERLLQGLEVSLQPP